MSVLRIGIIGVEGRGRLADLWENPALSARVTAGADINPDYLKAFQARHEGAFVTNDYREILRRDDIDAVGVFSPDFMHEEHAVAALEAGKHLFCEKPLAITVEGCDRILRAWKKSGKKFLMGFNMRYMHHIRTMKQIVDEGVIGQVKSVWVRHFVGSGGSWYFHDWHARRANTTSLLLQKASHDIDVVHWIAGGHGKRVVAMGGRHFFGGNKPNDLTCVTCGIRETCAEVQPAGNPRQLCAFRKEVDVEDVSHLLWELDNGVQCAYMQCHFAPHTPNYRNYVFIGTEGMAETVHVDGHEAIQVTARQSGTWKDYADRLYTIKPPPGGHGGADPIIAREFLDMLQNNITPTATPIDGRHSVAVGCAGAASLRQGSVPIDVSPVPEL